MLGELHFHLKAMARALDPVGTKPQPFPRSPELTSGLRPGELETERKVAGIRLSPHSAWTTTTPPAVGLMAH